MLCGSTPLSTSHSECSGPQFPPVHWHGPGPLLSLEYHLVYGHVKIPRENHLVVVPAALALVMKPRSFESSERLPGDSIPADYRFRVIGRIRYILYRFIIRKCLRPFKETPFPPHCCPTLISVIQVHAQRLIVATSLIPIRIFAAMDNAEHQALINAAAVILYLIFFYFSFSFHLILNILCGCPLFSYFASGSICSLPFSSHLHGSLCSTSIFILWLPRHHHTVFASSVPSNPFLLLPSPGAFPSILIFLSFFISTNRSLLGGAA